MLGWFFFYQGHWDCLYRVLCAPSHSTGNNNGLLLDKYPNDVKWKERNGCLYGLQVVLLEINGVELMWLSCQQGCWEYFRRQTCVKFSGSHLPGCLKLQWKTLVPCGQMERETNIFYIHYTAMSHRKPETQPKWMWPFFIRQTSEGFFFPLSPTEKTINISFPKKKSHHFALWGNFCLHM